MGQRRPLLASLAGRLVPSGGGGRWATVSGQQRSQLSADPLGSPEESLLQEKEFCWLGWWHSGAGSSWPSAVPGPASRVGGVRERQHVPSVSSTGCSAHAASPVLPFILVSRGAGNLVPRPGSLPAEPRSGRTAARSPGLRGVRSSPAARVGGARRAVRRCARPALACGSTPVHAVSARRASGAPGLGLRSHAERSVSRRGVGAA
jgi:hypothetical protein